MMRHILLVSTAALAMMASACTPKRAEVPQPNTTPVATTPTTPATTTPVTPANTGTTTNTTPVPIATTPTLTPAEIAARTRAQVMQQLMQVGERVYFDTDSFALSAQAQSVLQSHAAILMAAPSQRVIIEGNCDERGTREYNLALGERRANAVRDYLISLGVPETQIDVISFGKERPIDDRPSEEGWSVNRNAHTRVLVAG